MDGGGTNRREQTQEKRSSVDARGGGDEYKVLRIRGRK